MHCALINKERSFATYEIIKARRITMKLKDLRIDVIRRKTMKRIS